ncbi:MAG: diguanylate cyclase [Rhizobiales bacterium]|jgi:diguanylate cyclase|nr:diguanylate cyclase [Hyphomicrobiales bacterium]
MHPSASEHERTIALANIALGQIRALRLSAEPRNYEFFFCYAGARNPAFNKAVNERLAARKTLSDADIAELYQKHLTDGQAGTQVETLGAKVVGEIDQVMAMIDVAVGSTSSYSATLADASQQIGHATDREALRAIVESLVGTTKEAERANHALEARLQASRQEIRQLHESLEAVRNESLTDPLTTLSNRKYFDQALSEMMAEAAKKSESLSLMMVDIDHFKAFNDNFGHLTGDQVLRLVALCIKENVKGLDIAARYGGEEFAVILPDTALRQALTVGEHIRRAVMMKELMKRSTGESLGRVSISAGIALYRRGETVRSFIGRADACLYAAKRTGRNKVVCESDPEFIAAANAQVA